MKDKIIIHNYTDLDDYDVLYYVLLVVNGGKVSKTKQGEQYCFITSFKKGVGSSLFQTTLSSSL